MILVRSEKYESILRNLTVVIVDLRIVDNVDWSANVARIGWAAHAVDHVVDRPSAEIDRHDVM